MKAVLGFFILFFSLNCWSTTPETADQIPGMSYLLKTISDMPVAEEVKDKMLSAVAPSEARIYYRLGDDFLDPDTRDQLIHEYSDLYHVPPDQVTLFAVTNPTKLRTVLLPAFYQLKTAPEQAAALFHEAMWILGSPGMTYPLVVRIEKSALDFFRNPDDPNAVFTFYKNMTSLYDVEILLDAALDFDQKHGSLPKNLVDIFGEDFMKCYFLDQKLEEDCEDLLKYYLVTAPLAQTSLFLQAFSASLDQMASVWMPTTTCKFPVKTLTDLAAFEKMISISIERNLTRGPVTIVLIKDQQRVGLIEIESLIGRR